MKWLPADRGAEFLATGTDCFRLAESRDLRVEVFARAVLISSLTNAPEGLVPEIRSRVEALNLPIERIFFRHLVHGPGKQDVPITLWQENAEAPLCQTVRENGVSFLTDFSLGYSCGLFLDQRANRQRLHTIQPRKILNCFSYTCSFSVVAACAGASTLSVDVAKAALERGKANFAANDLGLEGHRFIADDVFDVLPRLVRRGEKFDAIILDPPTFSRGAKGRVFRAEDHYGKLVELACDLSDPGTHLLLSTNCTSLTPHRLASFLPPSFIGRVKTWSEPTLPDITVGGVSSTLWVRIGG